MGSLTGEEVRVDLAGAYRISGSGRQRRWRQALAMLVQIFRVALCSFAFFTARRILFEYCNSERSSCVPVAPRSFRSTCSVTSTYVLDVSNLLYQNVSNTPEKQVVSTWPLGSFLCCLAHIRGEAQTENVTCLKLSGKPFDLAKRSCERTVTLSGFQCFRRCPLFSLSLSACK